MLPPHCNWTDDADLMSLHDELGALLCAVTCEANEAELDAALDAFDHMDADRLGAANLVRATLNQNFARPLLEILKAKTGESLDVVINDCVRQGLESEHLNDLMTCVEDLAERLELAA